MKLRHYGEFTLELRDVAGDVSVSLDIDKIAKHLGAKALRNKGHKATMMHGAIVVRAKQTWKREP